MDVGIRELKAKLSEYLGRAASGEEIVVTDRGVPVVRIVPFADDALQRGFEEGWIEAPRRQSPGGLAHYAGHGAPRSTVEVLEEDRGGV